MTLYEPLPYHVEVDGKIYKLNPYFDRILETLDVIQNEWPEEAKEKYIIWLLVKGYVSKKKRLKVIQAIFDKLLFYDKKDITEKKTIDFQQDSKYIFAAFLQAYNINLYDRKKPIHWFEFLWLLESLPDNTHLSQIMSIRAKRIPKTTKYNREEIGNLIKLKNHYKLKETEDEQNRRMQSAWANVARTLEAMSKRKE